jgi:murein DD-endopeptidase MepM/ murein hydrolase activator NlpD
VIRLAQPDMFFTGNTLVIDHGFGVNSVYAHLSKILVKDGQSVARGQPVGEIGATGRATGPHLHWGLNLFQERLDPALVLGPMPGAGQ